MSALYSYNDWRDYALVHERKSQWTDENGRNTPAYNHKYYEEHREEIIKRVTENRRNSVNNKDLEENGRDITKSKFGTAYADENEKRDYINSFTNGTHLSEYASEMDEDFADQNSKHTEYSKDVLENVRKNNQNVMDNIKKLSETVDKYLAANKDKLSQEQIAKLVKDTTQQIALEQKRLINLDSKEGKSYVDGLLKGDGQSSSKFSKSSKSSKSSDSAKKSSSSTSNASNSSSSSGSSSPKDTGKNDKKKTAIDTLVDKYGDLTPEERRKMKHSEDYSSNDWRYYLQHKDSKWEWKDGKNSSEYNHWYYLNHPEKWGKVVGDAIGNAASSVKKAYDDWGTKPRVMDDGKVLMPDGSYRTKEWYDSHYDKDGNEINTSNSEKKNNVTVSLNLPNPSTASSSDDYYIDDKGMYRLKDESYYQKEAEEEKRKKEEEEERKKKSSKTVTNAVKVLDYMNHSEEYTYNDWRYYLQHKAEKGKSKYDWSSGKNPPDYNHDYWEKNKEEILAQRAKKAGKSVSDVEKENIRDFGGSGIGYKSKKDGTDGTNLSDYENDDDWTDELTDDEKKNIEAHNKQVDENIANLKKTVEDYIAANKDKLGEEGIKKLRDNLQTQIDIANEQRINTKNSDDYNYIMGLRKKNGGSSKADSSSSDSSTPKQTTAKNSTSKSSSSSSSQSSNSKPKKTQEEMKQEEWERMTETKRKEAEEFAKQREAANKAKEDNFNYDNEEARRRKEEQERIRRSGRSTR